MKKIVVYVPFSHTGQVRTVIGQTDGGKIGNYSHCTFSVRGVGRFKPEAGANPHIGKVGELESVEEEKIEFVCEDSLMKTVISAIKEVHPYEEVALDVYNLEQI